MRIRNQHPDAHAAKQTPTWDLSAKPDGNGYMTYTNDNHEYRTFQPFKNTKLEGMVYLLRTSGYDVTGSYYRRLPDGSFASKHTQLSQSDVWVAPGQSCTATEYCIVAPAEFNVLQAVGIGCFTGGTAAY